MTGADGTCVRRSSKLQHTYRSLEYLDEMNKGQRKPRQDKPEISRHKNMLVG